MSTNGYFTSSAVVIATAAVLVRHRRRHPSLSTTVIRHYVKNPHLRILLITSPDFLCKICLQFTHCNIRTSAFYHQCEQPVIGPVISLKCRTAGGHAGNSFIEAQHVSLHHRPSPAPMSGLFSPWTFRPMDTLPHGKTFCPMDVLPHGRLASETIRPRDNTPQRRFAPRTLLIQTSCVGGRHNMLCPLQVDL